MRNLGKYLLIFILIVIAISVGVSYSYFQANIEKIDENPVNVSTGSINLNVSDVSVKVDNIIPIYDNQYETLAYNKEFVVSNVNGTLNACTSIFLNLPDFPSDLKNEYLKYKLVTSGNTIYEGNFSNISDNKLLLSNDIYLKSGEYDVYNLYIWISYDENLNQMKMLDKNFNANIYVKGFDSNDGICNGGD